MQNRKRPHSADLRKGRWSVTGQIYHITACTLARQPVFLDFGNARILIRILREEALRGKADTLAFVVMPDHFHWMMQLHEGDLPRVVGRVKSLAARQLGRRIWQEGFHDHGVRKEEDLRAIARYIVANPLRAGIVDTVGDYPHWDVIWL